MWERGSDKWLARPRRYVVLTLPMLSASPCARASSRSVQRDAYHPVLMNSSPADALAMAIHRVTNAVRHAPISDVTPDALVQLSRVSTDANTMERLRQEDLARVAPRDVLLAAMDAEQLAQLLEGAKLDPLTNEDLERTTLLSDRLMRTIGYLALPRPSSSEKSLLPGDVAARHDDSKDALDDLVHQYRADASRERGIMRWLYAAAMVSLAIGVVIALRGVSAAESQSAFRFSEFVAYGLIALVAVAFSAASFHRAAKHGVAAQEATRLERQFHGLDAYLSPMPPALRDLVRGTLVQRLFPGVLEGEEPWREPSWPDTDALLEAIRNR
jgi:hypothetical protein